MHRTGGAARILRVVFAQADCFILQFARELRALERILTEKCFQLRILHRFRCLAKAFLPIFEGFDQVVDRRDNFLLLTHILSIRISREIRCIFRAKFAMRGYGLNVENE